MIGTCVGIGIHFLNQEAAGTDNDEKTTISEVDHFLQKSCLEGEIFCPNTSTCIDIRTPFLYGDLDTEKNIIPPEGYSLVAIEEMEDHECVALQCPILVG